MFGSITEAFKLFERSIKISVSPDSPSMDWDHQFYDRRSYPFTPFIEGNVCLNEVTVDVENVLLSFTVPVLT